ncbi:hypothetical protein GALMADRAFT_1190821 [Galerina marginata CBS 339.88]|uniref:Uncharacterized protein n=1 Tax=Galerina marginata (strain CBS 339.88) TaxID=685588 RepID=A0A067TAY9_GALM3|nr:hypothetical protein GALMADRAFT_1190821 [Galerina marginata CBS 339.88]
MGGYTSIIEAVPSRRRIINNTPDLNLWQILLTYCTPHQTDAGIDTATSINSALPDTTLRTGVPLVDSPLMRIESPTAMESYRRDHLSRIRHRRPVDDHSTEDNLRIQQINSSALHWCTHIQCTYAGHHKFPKYSQGVTPNRHPMTLPSPEYE